MPLLNPEVTQFRFIMCLRPASRLIVAFGAAVSVAGCAGESRTYYEPQPITLHRHAAQVRTRLIPAPSAPALAQPPSADEKQQLFQEFQASQSFKGQTSTAPETAR